MHEVFLVLNSCTLRERIMETPAAHFTLETCHNRPAQAAQLCFNGKPVACFLVDTERKPSIGSNGPRYGDCVGFVPARGIVLLAEDRLLPVLSQCIGDMKHEGVVLTADILATLPKYEIDPAGAMVFTDQTAANNAAHTMVSNRTQS